MKRQKRRRAFAVGLEHLETRQVLSAYNIPWPDSNHLTLSFAQDGTSDAGQRSALYSVMSNAGDTASWQKTILRAFQTWASVANISIGVTSDGGQAFGSPGAVQGDSRFGDIRIGAIAQSPGVLAVSQPPGQAGGTWAGDMNFNTADILSLGGQPNSIDLYTLALHEAGHSLGLADNNDPSSVLYQNYQGIQPNGLSAGDVSAIQALYGPRPSVNPSALPSGLNTVLPDGSNAFDADAYWAGSLSGPADDHSFHVQPSAAGTYTINVSTGNFSSLLARVTAYDNQGNLLGSAVVTDQASGGVNLTLPNLASGSNIHFTVTPATNDVFSYGGFTVRVTPAGYTPPTSTFNDVYTNGYVNDTGGANSTKGTALKLQSISSGSLTSYLCHASLTPTAPSDYYRINGLGGKLPVLISTWGLNAPGPDALINVYDGGGKLLPTQIIHSDSGQTSVQVIGASGTMFVQVVAATPGGPGSTGNYALAVYTGNTPETVDQAGSGSLVPTKVGGSTTWSTSAAMTLNNNVNGIEHFVLADSSTSAPGEAALLTITDASGNVVGTLQSGVNRTRSLDLWLTCGIYTLTITVIPPTSGPASQMQWVLGDEELSNPMLSNGYTGTGSSSTTYPLGQKPPPPPA